MVESLINGGKRRMYVYIIGRAHSEIHCDLSVLYAKRRGNKVISKCTNSESPSQLETGVYQTCVTFVILTHQCSSKNKIFLWLTILIH